MQCPVCDVTLLISSREGIEIDHCPQCRGVWLDRGELDKVIERAAPAMAGARAGREPVRDDRPRRQPPPRDPSYRRKRRESFLEDLFDFD